MENKAITEYLAGLRAEGEGYYDIYEILESYARMIDHLVKVPYDDIREEHLFDMEIWFKLEFIKNILESSVGTEKESGKNFTEKMKQLDEEYMKITIPVVAAAGLPWWYYRVFKRAGSLYAADIKSRYGIDIEIFE